MGFIASALGLKRSAPPVPVAPPAPAIDDKAAQAAAEEERRKRGNSGRASTVLTSPTGLEDDTPGSKILLGAGY